MANTDSSSGIKGICTGKKASGGPSVEFDADDVLDMSVELFELLVVELVSVGVPDKNTVTFTWTEFSLSPKEFTAVIT